jgi:sulfate permease, SulP family
MFEGLQGLRLAQVPSEVSAGITLAALIIPLNIGYAQVAGLPPISGLYAGILPLVVFALFTSSRYVVGSPDATIAAILGAVLIGYAPIGDPLRMQYALALALLSGLLFFVFWHFRLAFLANFLSRAVLAGFISGLAISVLTSQTRKILGVSHVELSGLVSAAQNIKDSIGTSVTSTGYFVELITLFESIPHANPYTFTIGAGTFVLLLVLKKCAPKLPAALATLLLMTVIVAVFDLEQKGVKVLGTTPSGLPSLTLPAVPLTDYAGLLPSAMAIVGIILCKALLLVRNCNRKHKTHADGDQVLFAYGMASIASGFSGSLVTGPSSSRTAAMDAAGSRTQLSSLVAAATVTLVMMFFTDELASLPTAALAGIIAHSVLSQIEVEELRQFWRMRRSEFWVAVACLLSVLLLGPLQAVTIAFLLSTIDLIRRASHPGAWVLREAQDGSYLAPQETGHTHDTPGIFFFRFGASLYFANANYFVEEVEKLVTQTTTPLKWFVLDASAINDMDTTGEEALRETCTWLAKRGVTVAVSRTNPSVHSLLRTYRLADLIGENRLYPTNRQAIAAFRLETGLI